MKKTADFKELKNTSYELFILLLSILSLFNLVILILPSFTYELVILKKVISGIDIVISIIFIGDFLYRFFTAESKTTYFFRNWGWADLLASIPAQQLKIFRIFRVVRVIRLLRRFGWRNMLREVRHNRADSALYITLFLVIIVLEFAGAAIVMLELGADNANIETAADAIWWAFVTITTVGYGDHYPVTTQGRVLGMLVMIIGVGLFAVFTSFLANIFLQPNQDETTTAVSEPTNPQSQIATFKRLLEEQEKANNALKAQLNAIEEILTSQKNGQ